MPETKHRLTRSQLMYLQKLGDDWRSVHEIVGTMNLSSRGAGGMGRVYSILAQLGFAEWCPIEIDGEVRSHYRLTDAARAAARGA